MRFLIFRVPLHSTLPPLTSLSGHSPIHELNVKSDAGHELVRAVEAVCQHKTFLSKNALLSSCLECLIALDSSSELASLSAERSVRIKRNWVGTA